MIAEIAGTGAVLCPSSLYAANSVMRGYERSEPARTVYCLLSEFGCADDLAKFSDRVPVHGDITGSQARTPKPRAMASHHQRIPPSNPVTRRRSFTLESWPAVQISVVAWHSKTSDFGGIQARGAAAKMGAHISISGLHGFLQVIDSRDGISPDSLEFINIEPNE